jgi:hypothetical protein
MTKRHQRRNRVTHTVQGKTLKISFPLNSYRGCCTTYSLQGIKRNTANVPKNVKSACIALWNNRHHRYIKSGRLILKGNGRATLEVEFIYITPEQGKTSVLSFLAHYLK